MFSKKKKKPQISMPGNFEHRVHTGYDKREGKFIGLPLQWASIVGNNQILKSTNRPLPLVDPSEITPTEILDLKTIVRPQSSIGDAYHQKPMGMALSLPKTSHVARSNSLRSSSPPRARRDLRGNANVPPSVPEEPIQQYPSMRRDGTVPHQKMPPPVAPKNWQQPPQVPAHHQVAQQAAPPQAMSTTDHGQPMYQNGNQVLQPLNVHTDMTPANFYNHNNNNSSR